MNRKRGRPRKKPIDPDYEEPKKEEIEDEEKEETAVSDKEYDENTKTKKKKHETYIDMFPDFFTTLNSSIKIEDEETDESHIKEIKCGECNLIMYENQWDDHNYDVHYTFGWKVGQVPENDISNRKSLGVLKKILKVKKVLVCMTCTKKIKNEKAYVEHVLLCSKKKIEKSDTITCAVCNIGMEKTKWSNHKYKIHNNLAWRVGEPPLDLNDKHMVVYILNDLYKKKKPLFCNKCGGSKKSVVGFLSHQSMCSKTEEELEDLKVECNICQRKVLPVSMSMHMKVAHKLTTEEAPFVAKKEEVLEGKRKAAQRALEIINEFKEKGSNNVLGNANYTFKMDFENVEIVVLLENQIKKMKNIKCIFEECDFTYNTIMEGVEHIKNCEKQIESYFICKHCLIMFEKEFDMRNHINIIHNINQPGKWILYDPNCTFYSESENENNDEKYQEFNETTLDNLGSDLTKGKPKFLLPKFRRKPYKIYNPAFKWSLKFYEEHMSKLRIFESFYTNTSDCKLLEDNLLESYLPPLFHSCEIGVAMAFGLNNVSTDNVSFKKYKLFEEDLHDHGNLSIFVGGPVSAMTWLPTPYKKHNIHQILAVSVFKDVDKSYSHDEHYFEKTLIQFWDCGSLQYNSKDKIFAKFAFGLAHEYGPIWDMVWCPSGCYDMDESINNPRMGLLAVASSNSNVYIYSIPFLDKEASGLFYKLKPSLILKPGRETTFLGNQMFYPTKISWSKVKEHSKLAVGYSNGAVALYKLDMTYSLLKYNNLLESEVILPYKSFQAHVHYITGLELLPYPNVEIAVTTSFDRELYFWDLNTLITIYAGKKKTILSDLKWMTNWMGALCAFDEGSSSVSNPIPTMMNQIRDFLSDTTNIIPSLSTIKSISATDWLNTIAHASTSGELFSFIGNQLLWGLDGDKIVRYQKLVLGTTDLVNKDENMELSNVTLYKKAIQKYKVLLVDCKKDSIRDFGNAVNVFNAKMTLNETAIYPLKSINKIAFNPNLQASIFLATGHQIGLVRILPLPFLSDADTFKFLPRFQ